MKNVFGNPVSSCAHHQTCTGEIIYFIVDIHISVSFDPKNYLALGWEQFATKSKTFTDNTKL